MIRRLSEHRIELPAGVPVQVYVDDVELPSGALGSHIRIVSGDGHPGAAVIPVRGGDIGLVRSHRYVIGSEMWEIPRGFGEGPTPADDARRELREETGLGVDELAPLGVLHSNSGLIDGVVHLFLARIAPDSEASGGDGEVEEFRWFPIADVYEMAHGGAITDGFTIAALFRARPILQIDAS